MAGPISLPLYEKLPQKNTVQRVLDVTIFVLLLTLLAYRILSLKSNGFSWFFALLCESWFTFVWVVILSSKWNPVVYRTYPERLLFWIDELPPVDMFVTTADPTLEPPIITVNTVLSLLAVDYPANKLACYVSDDGCSPLTFYALLESSKFAKLWVPFCKKYGIHTRAPFRYFTMRRNHPMIIFKLINGSFFHSYFHSFKLINDNSTEFIREYTKMKDEYEVLRRKIEDATEKSIPCDLSSEEFVAFSDIERRNHPSIIKVILENKEGLVDGLPHLIYVSREKCPKYPHHYKAGALNVLTRVSGAMTNAPFILNVDCDMYANNSQIVFHAMCLLLGCKKGQDFAFAQSPQIFYDGLKDDPLRNQLVATQKYIGEGISGLQGPYYSGTGCFHRRKVLYGLWPDGCMETGGRSPNCVAGKLTDEGLRQSFGHSREFSKTVERILSGLSGKADCPYDLSSSAEAANQVADCGYECGTSWGTKIGWIYGSTSEDVLTGLKIHTRGWRSAECKPDPPAFLGCAPSGGPASLTQQKRWVTGLLEILFSKNNPFIATLTAKLQFRQCLAYMYILSWGLRWIPELCYTALPAYCIIANSHFLPKVEEPAFLILAALFAIYNLHSLLEYCRIGLSIRTWWNNQRMGRIITMTAWFFGFLNVMLKLLGLFEAVFEVTQKNQSSAPGDDNHKDAGRFTFNESPIFVPATTLVLVHLVAMVKALLNLTHGMHESRIGEVICNLWVLLCFLPFLKGLFKKGKYGIPSSTICKSAALAAVFVHLCKSVSIA